VDGTWLALGIGLVLAVFGVSSVVVDVMGASARVHPYALTHLRIGWLGAPLLLVTFAGTDCLRGLQDTRTTLVVAVAANVLNLALGGAVRLRVLLGHQRLRVGNGCSRSSPPRRRS
jgi:Na+-driven multidrug efflux pump